MTHQEGNGVAVLRLPLPLLPQSPSTDVRGLAVLTRWRRVCDAGPTSEVSGSALLKCNLLVGRDVGEFLARVVSEGLRSPDAARPVGPASNRRALLTGTHLPRRRLRGLTSIMPRPLPVSAERRCSVVVPTVILVEVL